MLVLKWSVDGRRQTTALSSDVVVVVVVWVEARTGRRFLVVFSEEEEEGRVGTGRGKNQSDGLTADGRRGPEKVDASNLLGERRGRGRRGRRGDWGWKVTGWTD